MILQRFLSVAFVCVFTLTLSAQAQVTWSEFGDGGADGGDMPSTGYDLSSLELGAIVGELSFSGDVDVYKIRILDPTRFSATTEIDAGTHPDTRLSLFSADSLGLYFNDDSPGDTLGLSTLPTDSLNLTQPGIYYLAVTMYEVKAIDEDSAQVFLDPEDFGPDWYRVYGPASSKSLAGWFKEGDGGEPFGTYRVSLTGTNTALSVEDDVPSGFFVSRAYPNPFVASARLELGVDQTQRVEAKLFDILGREIRTVYSGVLPGGSATELLIDGSGLPGGRYFVRVVGETFDASQLVTVTR